MTGLVIAPSLVYHLGMEKPMVCKACRIWFWASGEWDSTKEVPHIITCPNCGEPNEVDWPVNLEVKATR